jgi:diguanylate cyclase (GGDEF)-like protein
MVLPDTDARGAVRVCRRIARYVQKNKDSSWGDLPVPSLSFGIAVYPDCARQTDDLIRVADQAMYRAKREGGDCWRLGPDRPEGEPEPVEIEVDGAEPDEAEAAVRG